MSKKTLIGSFDNDDNHEELMKKLSAGATKLSAGATNLFKDDAKPEETVIIINGPNLNFLGVREIEKYGSFSYEELINKVQKETNGNLQFFQSNSEGDIVKLIQGLVRIKNGLQESDSEIIGLVINPGALTHTSVSLRDALSMLPMPIVEVHITDITKRENYRKTNLISDLCFKSIIGKGIDGYIEGVEYLYTL